MLINFYHITLKNNNQIITKNEWLFNKNFILLWYRITYWVSASNKTNHIIFIFFIFLWTPEAVYCIVEPIQILRILDRRQIFLESRFSWVSLTSLTERKPKENSTLKHTGNGLKTAKHIILSHPKLAAEHHFGDSTGITYVFQHTCPVKI